MEKTSVLVVGAGPVGLATAIDLRLRGLAVVVSAEAFFTLTDLCGLPPEAAIASAAQTARSLTAAALGAASG